MTYTFDNVAATSRFAAPDDRPGYLPGLCSFDLSTGHGRHASRLTSWPNASSVTFQPNPELVARRLLHVFMQADALLLVSLLVS